MVVAVKNKKNAVTIPVSRSSAVARTARNGVIPGHQLVHWLLTVLRSSIPLRMSHLWSDWKTRVKIQFPDMRDLPALGKQAALRFTKLLIKGDSFYTWDSVINTRFLFSHFVLWHTVGLGNLPRRAINCSWFLKGFDEGCKLCPLQKRSFGWTIYGPHR